MLRPPRRVRSRTRFGCIAEHRGWPDRAEPSCGLHFRFSVLNTFTRISEVYHVVLVSGRRVDV